MAVYYNFYKNYIIIYYFVTLPIVMKVKINAYTSDKLLGTYARNSWYNALCVHCMQNDWYWYPINKFHSTVFPLANLSFKIITNQLDKGKKAQSESQCNQKQSMHKMIYNYWESMQFMKSWPLKSPFLDVVPWIWSKTK